MHCLGISILVGKVKNGTETSLFIKKCHHTCQRVLTEELIVLVFTSYELFILVIVIKTYILCVCGGVGSFKSLILISLVHMCGRWALLVLGLWGVGGLSEGI